MLSDRRELKDPFLYKIAEGDGFFDFAAKMAASLRMTASLLADLFAVQNGLYQLVTVIAQGQQEERRILPQ